MSMTVTYQPTLDDVLYLQQALHRRARRHPLLWMVLLGGVALAAGGAMMASVASAAWWMLSLAGVLFAGTASLAARLNAPNRAKVERDYAARAWLRDAFSIEVDAEGLRYAHGPYRSRAAWPAFATLIETDHHLILLERRAPGALAYGLAKRELDKTPGGTTAWREFLKTSLRAARGAAHS